MTKNPIIICTTYPNIKEANFISKYLLEQKLAFCIQKNKITSEYIWEDKLQKEQEIKVEIKTFSNHYKKIKKLIKKYHSYKTPEVICIDIKKMDKSYQKWAKEITI